jgi:hypothetical protein
MVMRLGENDISTTEEKSYFWGKRGKTYLVSGKKNQIKTRYMAIKAM